MQLIPKHFVHKASFSLRGLNIGYTFCESVISYLVAYFKKYAPLSF